MKQIKVKPVLTDEQVSKLEGEFIDESYLKHPVINDDTLVLNEKDEPLVVFKKIVFPQIMLKWLILFSKKR